MLDVLRAIAIFVLVVLVGPPIMLLLMTYVVAPVYAWWIKFLHL